MQKFAMLAITLLATGTAYAQAPATSAPAASAPDAAAANSTPSGSAAPRAPATTSPEARVEQRIMQMHQRLKITPEQEANWNAFAQVMRDNVTAADAAYKQRRDSIATMSAPENMQNFAQIEQAHAQGVQNLASSFQTLYGSLSDDQKKTADAMFRHYEDHAAARKKQPR